MSGSTGITRHASESHRPHLQSLASLFAADLAQLGRFTAIDEQQLPEAYATLLAHNDHMTVTHEAFYESLVRVEVVAERNGPEWYARQSLLARNTDSAIVQYGIMRIDTAGLPEVVRRAIESHSAPLGRILIRNNLLRDVELLALWQIEPHDDLRRPLGLNTGEIIYGRSAAIHLAGQRAVDLLEIVTDHPVPPCHPII